MLFISTGLHEPMVISLDFQHYLCAGPYLRPTTRICTRNRFPALLGYLEFMSCFSALPACLALLPCFRQSLLICLAVCLCCLFPVVPCPALRFALPCLALPCGMDVKPTWANMATLAYRVDNVGLNPEIHKLGGPGRDDACACTRPGCRARRPHPLG